MTSAVSPNDPIFFMHHANKDRLWKYYQDIDPSNFNKYNGIIHDKNGNRIRKSASESDKISLFIPSVESYFGSNVTVKDMFNTSKWCYTYSYSVTPLRQSAPTNGTGSPSNTNTPPSSDRTDEFNLRESEPLSSENLKSLMITDVDRNMLWEEISRRYVEYVNHIDGYVSNSALVNVKNGVFRSVTKEEWDEERVVYGQIADSFTKSMGWHDLADFLTRYEKKDDDSQVVVSRDPERDAPRDRENEDEDDDSGDRDRSRRESRRESRRNRDRSRRESRRNRDRGDDDL